MLPSAKSKISADDAQLVVGVLGLDLLDEELLHLLVALGDELGSERATHRIATHVDRVDLLLLPGVLREALVLAIADHLARLYVRVHLP